MTLDARRQALEVLLRVDQGGYADRSLDAVLRRQAGDPRDRALLTELVYGVLRTRNRLDFALAHLTDQPLTKLEPRLLSLLRLGAYQIVELDRIPPPVAVHETVSLTKRIGLQRAAGLVNAVLRRLVRETDRLPWPDPRQDPVGYLTWRLSLPAWLARRWYRELGAEAFPLAESLLQPAPFTLRVNTLKTTRTAYLEALAGAGCEAQPTRFAPEGVTVVRRGPSGLPGDDQGLYQVQDEASMLIAPLLQPHPGERLFDACAAPGGKTTHLAALSGNRAAITAVDLHPHRLALVEQGARRLGCTEIETRVWDMTAQPDFMAPASCDGVLVDAPCSGLGVLRRNPEARWRLQPKDITDLQNRQTAILEQAARLVRPGGRLVYAVCTVTPEETGQTVGAFLDAHPEFVRANLAERVAGKARELIAADGALHSWPHRQGLDGFYAVRLERC